MGNNYCCHNEAPNHLHVSQIPNNIPNQEHYQLYSGRSNRYGDLSVITEDRNNYIFLLRNQKSQQIRVLMPVLNEVVHCAIQTNYKLKISKHMIIDIMDDSFKNTFINVKNERSGAQYSMRLCPFKGYNSYEFKKGLQEVWIHQKRLAGKRQYPYFLNLCDCFVYGVNPDKQVLVLLFDKIETNLNNVAQYRKLANWPWTTVQKVKIIYQLIESCSKLSQLDLVHRDIRPCNLFFNLKLDKYVLGNFSTARQMYSDDHHFDDDLMTVYGVQFCSEQKIEELIKKKQDIGLYNPQKVVYNGIKNVLKLLETSNLFDKNPHFSDEVVGNIYHMLNSFASFDKILKYISQQSQKIPFNAIFLVEDEEISRLTSNLLTRTHKDLIEEYQFQCYDCLGYHKQFSEIAHRIIQKNNENDKPFENAFLLKNLGAFYQKNGSKGTQYYINSCILFCQKAEQSIKYKKLQDAKASLEQAEEVYLKYSSSYESPMNLIEIKRLNALIKAEYNRLPQAKQIITKTVHYAAEKPLSVEKQMKLFLTSARIFDLNNEKQLCLERLKNGLAICENSGAFESPTSCALYKSRFLFELGNVYFQELREKHNPQKRASEQSYSPALKGNVQTYYKSALYIRERDSTDYFEVAECLKSLGSFYFLLDEFSESKACYRRALIQMNNMKSDLAPQLMAQVLYDLGSICYKLKEFNESQGYYKEAIQTLSRNNIQSYWMHCIEGNLALVFLQTGRKSQGQTLLQQTKDIIRKQKGENHYDYVFLVREQNLINSR